MTRPLFLLILAGALAACGPAGTPDATAPADQADRAAELAGLERLQADVEAARASVAGFEVLYASYGHGPDPVSGQPVPTVKVALANGSPVAVARVSLRASFSLDGEGEPWHDQVFDVPLVDTLVPGAGGAVTMTPRGDSDWALKAPAEGVPVRVRIVPLALQTPDGQRLPTEHAFGADERRRLAELRGETP